MPSFHATTTVPGSPRTVWDTLLCSERWPSWDPGLDRVEGRLTEHGRPVVHAVGVARPFRLRVTVWEPERRLVLTGGAPFGLFTGIRTYRLVPDGDRTRFAVDERYRGPLTPLIGRTVPDLQPSFDAFVAGLRAAVEQAPP